MSEVATFEAAAGMLGWPASGGRRAEEAKGQV